ncbi:MAG: enoyl-CoA hydratase/isomerase family protein [Longimicrobiales bacterium]
MSGPPVLAEPSDGIMRLTLNRPDKRNALNREVVELLRGHVADAGADPQVRVVSLLGSGRDFCAGADLREVAATQAGGSEQALKEADDLGQLFVQMRKCPKPVVAVVHGRALAGGCGLASACDLVLAHEEAEFGYPEVNLGFVPAMVMTILRRKVGESVAFELVVRGERLSASQASAIGLVNRVIPDDAFQPAVHEYLADLASRPPGGVALTKRLLYGLDGVGFEEGIARGAEVNAVARLTDECRAGVARFLAGGPE